MLTDSYSTGVKILEELMVQIRRSGQNDSYALRRSLERSHRKASLRLLAPIAMNRLKLSGAREIGFLEELYPDRSHFALPFIQVQELHGAWKRYQQGVHFAVLGHRIHPYYGTYAPTRVSHLELFGTWLSQYQGEHLHAVDVGTGCGVLSFMLCRAGFESVLATDCNPNAVESVARERKRLPTQLPIEIIQGDLLCGDSRKADLIVFNPPWLQGDASSLVDGALYFQEGLFQRFFAQAAGALATNGRIVLVFSNIMQLVQPDLPHPILTELERGRLRLVQRLRRKVKATADKDGRRRKTRERVEVWELEMA
jgi:predicted nicotinamide N-methyase